MPRRLLLNIFISFLFLPSSVFSSIKGEIKLCAIRVSFPLEDDESTTGDGQFLNTTEGIDCFDYTIDKPPHNRSYFKSQIKAVSSYFDSVSYGAFKVDLENSDIYPFGENNSYELDSSMASYNPYGESSQSEEKITKLFQDVIILANLEDEINFSNYDLIVVFHAGIGQDFSLPFLDPTPQDIPSTYIDNDMIKENIEGGSLVINGHEILHGIVLPETQNHLLYEISNDMFSSADSPCEYQYGLTGTFALMIGFAIGLPPLWNIESGKSGVGIFGLMDQGSNNGRGVIPAPPTAWTRIYAGWEEATDISFNTNIELPSRSKNNIAKVNINDSEYFLIENRDNSIIDDISIDSLQYIMWKDSGEDSITPYINILFDSTDLKFDSNNVVISVPNYDMGLPKSGILIWHIDEQIINNGLNNFTINSNPSKLGVDLEEADGAQDIGYESFFAFNDPSSGYFGDVWFNGNVEYNRANPSMKGLKPRFGPDTYPNTKANNQSETFIVVDNISKAKKIMNFDLYHSLSIKTFQDTSISIHNVAEIFQNGDNQIIFDNDSLWVSDIDSIQNKILIHVPISENFITLFEPYLDYTSINIFEHQDNYTYHYKYEYNLSTETIHLKNNFNYSDYLYPYIDHHTDSLVLVSENTWQSYSNKVLSQDLEFKLSENTNKITVIKNNAENQLSISSIEYIIGSDIDSDFLPEIISIDTSGILSVVNLEGLLTSGFPSGYKIQSPILVRNLLGDDNLEIVTKSKDSTSIYVISSNGEILYKINCLKSEKLICLDSFDNQSSLVTNKRIIQFDLDLESHSNLWSYIHGNNKRNRYIDIKNTNTTNQFKIIHSYVYPNPIRNDLGTIRIETNNSKRIEVKIFDLAGYFIEDFNKDDLYDQGNQINEFIWDVSKIESGVYFAKVKVTESSTANPRSVEKIIKIAVLH
jgi:M6 family metalloprotease-like protein